MFKFLLGVYIFIVSFSPKAFSQKKEDLRQNVWVKVKQELQDSSKIIQQFVDSVYLKMYFVKITKYKLV